MHTAFLYIGVFLALQLALNLLVGLLTPYSIYQYFKNYAFVAFGMLTLSYPLILFFAFKDLLKPDCNGTWCIHFPLPFMMALWLIGTPVIAAFQFLLNYAISRLKLRMAGYR